MYLKIQKKLSAFEIFKNKKKVSIDEQNFEMLN